MDLFDMLSMVEPEAHQAPRIELVDELNMIIQKHGISVPRTILEDLASYYDDPPPWAPWVK